MTPALAPELDRALPGVNREAGRITRASDASAVTLSSTRAVLTLQALAGNAAVAGLLEPGSRPMAAGNTHHPALSSVMTELQLKEAANPVTHRTTKAWNVSRMTFYVGGEGLIVFELDDGTSQSLEAAYNGNPPPGDYLNVSMEGGRLRTTPPLGGKPNEKGNVIQWRAPDDVYVALSPPVLLSVRTGRPDINLPGAPGKGVPGGGVSPTAPSASADNLYFRYQSGFSFGPPSSPESRRVGEHIVDWAKVRGRRAESTVSLRQLQVDRSSEAAIIDATHLNLIVRIRDGNAVDPDTGDNQPDDFEGSPRARDRAILTLERHWGQVARSLHSDLARWYHNSMLEAYARTPSSRWDLVTDRKEIKRLRTSLYGHKRYIPLFGAGDVIEVGQHREPNLNVYDVKNDGVSAVWVYIDGHPSWYYRAWGGDLNRLWSIGQTFGAVAVGARFAGMILPLMIKAGGFALTFSPNPAIMIAGVLLDELGEEGLRDLSGEGRSFKDIAASAGQQILVNLVIGRLMGGGKSGAGAKGAGEAGEVLAKAVDKNAVKLTKVIEDEIAYTEGPEVAKALRGGEARPVTDEALRSEGFRYEVEIRHEGGYHTYRHKSSGEWCRWSPPTPICGIDLGQEIDEAFAQLEKGEIPQAAATVEGGLVEGPKPDVFKSIDPRNSPPGWQIQDLPIKIEGDWQSIRTNFEDPNGKYGWIERAYNPTTKELKLKNVFPGDASNMVMHDTPLVPGKGTPTPTYMTIRQMKILGAEFGELSGISMSQIENVEALLEFHAMVRDEGIAIEEAIMKAKSFRYVRTSMDQAGMKLTSVKSVTGGQPEKLENVLTWWERHSSSTGPRDPEIVKLHNKLLQKYKMSRSDVVLHGFDIEFNSVPY